MIFNKLYKKLRHSNFLHFVQTNFPYLFRILIVKPVSYYRFKKERLLVKNKLTIDGKKNSILFFTTHKSASTFVDKILDELSAMSSFTRVDFDSYFTSWNEKLYLKYSNNDFLNNAFISEGIIYGPFRNYVHVPKLYKYKIILLVRDPRDVLVSSYYSFRHSHLNITKKNVQQKKELATMTIDDFVKQKAAYYFDVLNDYCTYLLNRNNVLFLKYEDMLVNYDNFIFSILQFTDDLNLKHKFELKSKFKIKSNLNENKNKHVRRASPGEYKEKLEVSTIKYLNYKFSEILIKLGYK